MRAFALLLLIVAAVAIGLRLSRQRPFAPGEDTSQAPGATGEPTLRFASLLIDPSDIHADCKAVGDLNGDGRPDVIVAGNDGTPLQWYESPTWTKRIIDARSVFTTDMQTADVDRDGDVDIVVPDEPANSLLWYRNPHFGGGDWAPVRIGEARVHDLVLGDVDHDGRMDAVVRGHEGPTVLFLQFAPAHWARVPVTTAPDGEGVALGDLDGDGDLDIVENGFWLETPADPTAAGWTPHRIAGRWPTRVSVKVSDVDGDRRPDVILAPSESAGRMVWYQGGEDPRLGSWREHEIDGAVQYVHHFEVVDLDGDRDLDIAFAEMHQSPQKRVGIFLKQQEDWKLQVLSTEGSHNIRAADVDGDGAVDILGANWAGTSPLRLWKNLGVWAPQGVHTGDEHHDGTEVVDINGEGDRDMTSIGWAIPTWSSTRTPPPTDH